MESRPDRISSPAPRGVNLTLWLIILILPAVTFALAIGLGILGLIVRLFGA